MGLFEQILGAIDDPNQQASPDQLSGILGNVQQLGQRYGMSPSTTQTVMTVVGNYVRSSLQQKQAVGGNEQTQAIVNQYSGVAPNFQAVQTLFGPNEQSQVIHEAAQRSGLDPSLIQAMLPVIVPLILNLLQSGSQTQHPQAANGILNTFLDTDRNGAVDVGDVIGLASRFLNQPR